MSIPNIPGHLGHRDELSLDDVWRKSADGFPVELWPSRILKQISRNPTSWITVEENFFTPEEHGGAGCVLVRTDQLAAALSDTTWIGRELGDFGVWSSDEVQDGLVDTSDEVQVEFFVQGRRPSGSSEPHIDVALPFLWYWDAFRSGKGWHYVNRAGRDQPLIRFQVAEDSWRVEVRALEFRQFLATIGRVAILQRDHVVKIQHEPFDRVDDDYRSEWAHFDFHVMHERSMGDRPAFSRLLGQHALTPLRNSRLPRFEDRKQDSEYPEFIYALDSETGKPLMHVADPDQLGTYFDKDGSRLHYLTPIYFKREVLQPYAAEPGRYRLSQTRLSCLDVWGVQISFNSAGLVEVYLGDLGRDLPADEWSHWLAYNVPPEGEMDEGRFRRDFLNQWASSPDPMLELRNALNDAIRASANLLDGPIWRELDRDLSSQLESLIGPMSTDPASFAQPILTLSKALVDSIDPAVLRPEVATEPGDQSLRLLQKYMDKLGDESDVTSALRGLQALRSRGGIAHIRNSQSDRALVAMGIEGLNPLDAFNEVAQQVARALRAITALMESGRA